MKKVDRGSHHTPQRTLRLPAAARARGAFWFSSLTALTLGACGALPDAVVEPASETVTSEEGGSVDVLVRLERPPHGTVTVRAVSSDLSEATVSEPVTFDRSNWDDPQIITVTGVDDDEPDGDVRYTVRFEASKYPDQVPRLRAVLEFINRDAGDAASFAGIGDLPGGEAASEVRAISADGIVIVGFSSGANGEEAVRYSALNGLAGLGAAPSRATDVSPDGSAITGRASGGPGDTGPGAIWRVGQPIEFLEGDQGGAPPELPPLFELVDPEVVLDDGTVFGMCQQYGNPIPGPGCRQDGPGEIEIFPTTTIIYAADALNNYGGVILGNRYGVPLLPAILNGGPVPYPVDAYCITPGVCDAVLRAFSEGATLAVGTARMPPPRGSVNDPAGALEDAAWIYTAAEGVTARLPDLPGGVQASGAYAISAAGRVVGGFGTDAMGQRAVLWIDRAAVALEQLVTDQGGTIPAGWELREVRALSSDGLVVAGNGINPAGAREGFRVVLSRLP